MRKSSSYAEVVCPRCGAKPFEVCKRENGKPRPWFSSHKERDDVYKGKIVVDDQPKKE